MTQDLVIWVDENDKVLGLVSRVQAHDKQKLLLHRETMELIYSDSTHTRFWLQKRSQNKEQYPGKWTLSATCHVNPGDITSEDPEGYLTAGQREGMEEINLKVVKQRIVKKIVSETAVNKAILGLVVAECEGKPTPDLNEVSEVKLFDKESVRGITDELTPAAVKCLQELDII